MSQRRNEIEQARRHANRAAKRGDHAAAERWSKTVERLAAAAGAMSTAQAAEAEAQRLEQNEAEEVIMDVFAKAAYLASAMVHAPTQAPAAFENLVRLWREHNLGEGEADAQKAAAKVAASHAAYLSGALYASFPDEVRARMQQLWTERRAALVDAPLVPRYWEETDASGG